jgi:hypothetical protein
VSSNSWTNSTNGSDSVWEVISSCSTNERFKERGGRNSDPMTDLAGRRGHGEMENDALVLLLFSRCSLSPWMG